MKLVRHAGRLPQLNHSSMRRLRRQLGQVPEQAGLTGKYWSGALLARFLQKEYGVRLSSRQCRRILAEAGVARPAPAHKKPSQPCPALASLNAPQRRTAVISDSERKIGALRKIQRLCSSGLPLEPLVQTLFEVIDEAIPYAANKVFLADSGINPSRYLMNNPELAQWNPVQKHFYIDAPPAVSGMRCNFGPSGLALMKAKPVWRSDELALPHFYRSAGYYEFLRPLGYHHMLWLVFEEHGETRGYCPIWRGEDMPPFTRDDIQFATLAAPHIAHGLKLADDMESRLTFNESEFVGVPGTNLGLVTCDARGRIVAIDPEAAAIFFEMGIFDGLRAETIQNEGLCEAFAYVGRLLSGVFDYFNCKSKPPMVAAFSHRTGASIRLRGFRTYGTDNTKLLTLLVEPGELAHYRRMRLTMRFGFNPTELKILDSLRQEALKNLAEELQITRGTLKSYTQRLTDKLGVVGLGGLRAFAREQWY
jgi:DNA-binding CsgD family transcriptional regulator